MLKTWFSDMTTNKNIDNKYVLHLYSIFFYEKKNVIFFTPSENQHGHFASHRTVCNWSNTTNMLVLAGANLQHWWSSDVFFSPLDHSFSERFGFKYVSHKIFNIKKRWFYIFFICYILLEGINIQLSFLIYFSPKLNSSTYLQGV